MGNQAIDNIVRNVSGSIVGKEKQIRDVLKAIIAGGHILIEDVPGIGKTSLIKAISNSIGLKCNRVQFTTDILPADILGVSVYDDNEKNFVFRKGPIFTNILLADELNRGTTKTQSALLEAMEEEQITEWGMSYKLEYPFIVMATQNPISNDGTFNLPQSQLDRFMIKIKIGYLDKNSEIDILDNFQERKSVNEIKPIIKREELIKMIEECKEVYVKRSISEYIVSLCRATRKDKRILLGVSTRGMISLYKLVKANAYVNGRNYVIPEDVIECSPMALAHRIVLTNAYGRDGIEEEVIENILKNIEIPKVD